MFAHGKRVSIARRRVRGGSFTKLQRRLRYGLQCEGAFGAFWNCYSNGSHCVADEGDRRRA
ncbi:MAG: hypothetical protein ACTS40_01210 [Candidatus Hodgkinia cicadicola]